MIARPVGSNMGLRRTVVGLWLPIVLGLLVQGCAAQPGSESLSARSSAQGLAAPTTLSDATSARTPLSVASPTLGPPSAAQLSHARALANKAAAANGDPGSVSGVAVLAMRDAAMSYVFSGPITGPNVPVMVVLVHGRFNGEGFDVPPGQTAQRGDELVAIVDLQTGMANDVAQRNVAGGSQELDLTTLGIVAPLPS